MKRKFKNPEQAKLNMIAGQKRRKEKYGYPVPYIRTKEIRENISKILKGRKLPEVQKEKIRINTKIALNKIETKEKMSKSHTGMKQTQNTKNKKSKSLKKFYETHESKHVGHKHTAETIKKMRVARENAMRENRHFKGYFRNDLNKYFRSKLEANYARFMKWMDIKYEYETEKCVFKLKNGETYICDFYLPEIEQYIETKGYDWKNKSKNKYENFKLEYPQIKWNILYQNNDEWKRITKDYSNLIPNWEY
jgi:hypothetical protein